MAQTENAYTLFDKLQENDDLFISGYHRAYEASLRQIIPKSIQTLIKKYILPPFTIYGVGCCYSGQFGLGNRNNLSKYTVLRHASYLSPERDSLHCMNGTYIIEHVSKLYIAGNSYYGRAISRFEELQLPQNTNFKDFRLISQTKCAEVTFISATNEKNEQTIYGFGSLNNCLSMMNYFESVDSKWAKLDTTFVGNDDMIVDIQIGTTFNKYYVFVLSKNGRMWANHWNEYSNGNAYRRVDFGRVNFGNANDNIKIKKMSVGRRFVMCISEQNKLWVFGSNADRALHISGTNGVVQPPTMDTDFKDKCVKDVVCGHTFSVVVDEDGNGYASHGRNVYDRNDPKIHNYKIKQVDCGDRHCIILTEKNEIVTFGDNSYHQCSPWKKSSERIQKPYLVTKEEIGIDKNCAIERVIADSNASLILVQRSF